MASPSRPSSQTSSNNPDASLLNGLAALSALVRRTTEEIKEGYEAGEEGQHKPQNRGTPLQEGTSAGGRQSTIESSEDSSLLEIIRDEVKELVEVVEELREDPEAARMKSENAYLRQQVEYLIQKNQHDLLTSIQNILQTNRDEQRFRHAELMRAVRDKRPRK